MLQKLNYHLTIFSRVANSHGDLGGWLPSVRVLCLIGVRYRSSHGLLVVSENRRNRAPSQSQKGQKTEDQNSDGCTTSLARGTKSSS